MAFAYIFQAESGIKCLAAATITMRRGAKCSPRLLGKPSV